MENYSLKKQLFQIFFNDENIVYYGSTKGNGTFLSQKKSTSTGEVLHFKTLRIYLKLINFRLS